MNGLNNTKVNNKVEFKPDNMSYRFKVICGNCEIGAFHTMSIGGMSATVEASADILTECRACGHKTWVKYTQDGYVHGDSFKPVKKMTLDAKKVFADLPSEKNKRPAKRGGYNKMPKPKVEKPDLTMEEQLELARKHEEDK